MKVLSLFDGIACGRLALKRAGIQVDSYDAFEIDKAAIKVATTNFPDINEWGDVRNADFSQFVGYDLLIGGSPCTNFSSSGKRNGMTTKDKFELTTLDDYLKLKEEGCEFDGQSYLFWEYVRALRTVKPKFFLLENVKMKKQWQDIITRELGVEPIEINSNLVSAQNRVRLYWTNIPNVMAPADKGIKLADILENIDFLHPGAIRGRNVILHKATIIGRRLNPDGHREDNNRSIPIIQCLEVRKTNCDKSNCLTTVEKDNVLTPLPVGRYADCYGLISGNRLPFRHYTRTEYERLQTLPDGYTRCISESAAKKAIGNGWTVDVIAHIFNNLNS